MTNTEWIFGVAVTLLCVFLSWYARRWWPVAYVLAIFFGAGTGLMLWPWPEWMVSAWWSFGLGYCIALPPTRMVLARRNRRRY